MTAAGRVRLPVCGEWIEIRHPTGAEDVLVAEAGDHDGALALTLAERLAAASGGAPIDARALSVTDIDVFVLRLRQIVIGDRIRADVTCDAPGCGNPFDVSFGIEDYLGHHLARAGRAPRGMTIAPCAEDAGWYRLVPRGASGEQDAMQFRLPSIADEIVVAGRPDAVAALVQRLMQPSDAAPRRRRAVEAAMEAIAPVLCDDLEGVCPDCGAHMIIRFDPRHFCLQELRERAGFVYEDIDLLAARYHWSESAILALPNVRRASYCDSARRRGLA